ncbi:MAG: SRPBCC family protein [Bacteroidales bacterium]|nr:SRPBCC family protein [Bacteroidales bacterium]
MKLFRRILLTVLVLVIVLVLTGFLLPRHVRIERSLVMPASRDLIFEQVNDFRNWHGWLPWLSLDSTMQVTFSGPQSGVGALLIYESNHSDVGNGKLLITDSQPYDSILLDLNFMENGTSTGKFLFTSDDQGTLVRWILESDLGDNPISRWFGLFMDRMVGNDFEQGLANLNEITSKIPAKPIIAVLEKEIPQRIVLSIRDTASPSTIESKLEDFYKKISTVIKQKKLTTTGVPFSLYHSYSPQSFDVEAGIPVNKKITNTGEVECKEFPATKAAMASYFGPYTTTAIVYEAIEKYIKEKSLIISGGPWEEYITDPGMEPDTSKWQTDIYFPLK